MVLFLFTSLIFVPFLNLTVGGGLGRAAGWSWAVCFFHFAVKPFFFALTLERLVPLRLDGICLFHGSAVIALEGNCGRVGSGVFASARVRYGIVGGRNRFPGTVRHGHGRLLRLSVVSKFCFLRDGWSLEHRS